MLEVTELAGSERLWWAGGALLALLGAVLLIRGFLLLAGKHPKLNFLPVLLERCRPPLWAFLTALCLAAWTYLLPEGEVRSGLFVLVRLALILSGAWLAVQVAFVSEDLAYLRHNIGERNNRYARRKRTQAQIVRRLAALTIVVVAAGGLLAAFTSTKTLTTLLVSAGVAGVIIGLSAQNALTNMVAGVQVAFTDLLRIDDVVVVEDEWGRVEDITLTYVVVRIWDERTIILPVSYFVSKPFQNWTRTEAQVIGTVHLACDYTVDVPALRRSLEEYLENHPLWDRRVQVIQMTETNHHGVYLRVLVSSADAQENWDLRCDVREHLVGELVRTQPGALPKHRRHEEVAPDTEEA